MLAVTNTDTANDPQAHLQAPSSWLRSLMRAARPPRRLISAHTDELRTASLCTHAAMILVPLPRST